MQLFFSDLTKLGRKACTVPDLVVKNEDGWFSQLLFVILLGFLVLLVTGVLSDVRQPLTPGYVSGREALIFFFGLLNSWQPCMGRKKLGIWALVESPKLSC